MSGFLGQETKYFYSLTPEVIDQALISIGIQPVGRTLALNSLENRVYNVEVKSAQPFFNEYQESFNEAFSKDQVVIKFYRPGRWSADAIAEEHQSLSHLCSMEIPVVTPFLKEEESFFKEKETGLFFAVFPKVIGRLKDELNKSEVEQLARLVARVHQGLKYLSFYKHRGVLSVEHFIDEYCDFLKTFDQAPKTLKDSFVQLASNLKPLIQFQLKALSTQRIHGDIHRGNVMWNSFGPFLMDFDDSLTGPIEQDLWLMIPGRDEEDKVLNNCFLETYREYTQTTPNMNRFVVESLRTLRMVRFVGWIAKRYEDPFFNRMFPQFLTDGFWEQQVLGLKEQWSLLQDY
jgi:Ser/Thr protein kinase RdoA (MazF antagonist)